MTIPQSVVDELMTKCGRCCCLCRRYKPLYFQVHHIIEKTDGGTDDPDNLIPVCLTCHSDAHTKTAMTRRFTPNELKQHRDSVFQLVADGKLPAGPPVDRMATFSASTAIEVVMPREARNKLSPAAVEILVKAASGSGDILMVNYSGGFAIHAGGAELIDSMDGRVEAKYRHGMNQLLSAELIEPRHGDDLYAVTHHGYLLADSLIAAGTT